jgi:hypothetical protein
LEKILFKSVLDIEDNLHLLANFIKKQKLNSTGYLVDNNIIFRSVNDSPSIYDQYTSMISNDPQLLSVFFSKVYDSYFNQLTWDDLPNSYGLDPDKSIFNVLYSRGFISPDLEPGFKVSSEEDIFGCYDYLLGNYPVSIASYWKRATSRFSNLTFHSSCQKTLETVQDGGFCDYSISFTDCLNALNQLDPTSDSNDNVKRAQSLSKFECSVQGKLGGKKDVFKFDFVVDGEAFIKLNCEYHLKPSQHNFPGNSKHYHNRVYFGFIPQGGVYKVVVAHIGGHLPTN